MKTKHILLVLFAATLMPLHAQELTLEQARALALENNKDIHKSQLTFEQTSYDVSTYKANYFPKLSLSAADFYSTSKGELTLHGGNLPIYMFNPATGSYVPNVTVNPDGSYTLNQYALFPDQTIDFKVKNILIAGIHLQQPLYMGGKVGTAYRMSKIGQKIAADNITLTRAQVILRTDEAYVMAVRASQLSIVARQYKRVLEELKKNIDSAVRHGLKTRNDQMKVQVKLNEAELSIQRADNAYHLACMNLAHVVGIPDAAPSDTTFKTPPATLDTPNSLRPEHAILQHKVDLAAEQTNLTRSDYLPNLALLAGYSYANGGEVAGRKFVDNGSAYVGVTLKWDILDFGERTHKIRSAKARQQIAQLELEDADERMTLELQQARNNWQEAQTEASLTQTALRQAAENMRLAQSNYDAGLEPLSDLLEAQALWQKAAADVVEARCQLQLAHTRYLKASGQL
ncbi:MAG: TolC family protein [Bacteroidales bacterium]|nr:TolC family protein [Bacteroidales bacterium]